MSRGPYLGFAGGGAKPKVDPANKSEAVCAVRVGGVHCACWWQGDRCCDCFEGAL